MTATREATILRLDDGHGAHRLVAAFEIGGGALRALGTGGTLDIRATLALLGIEHTLCLGAHGQQSGQQRCNRAQRECS